MCVYIYIYTYVYAVLSLKGLRREAKPPNQKKGIMGPIV